MIILLAITGKTQSNSIFVDSMIVAHHTSTKFRPKKRRNADKDDENPPFCRTTTFQCTDAEKIMR
jgi:hypothetical protein